VPNAGEAYRALVWVIFTHNIDKPSWSNYVLHMMRSPIAGYTSDKDLTPEIDGLCRCKICVSKRVGDNVKLDK
jgi:hypothetical protein